jgi:hypothetical protein
MVPTRATTLPTHSYALLARTSVRATAKPATSRAAILSRCRSFLQCGIPRVDALDRAQSPPRARHVVRSPRSSLNLLQFASKGTRVTPLRNRRGPSRLKKILVGKLSQKLHFCYSENANANSKKRSERGMDTPDDSGGCRGCGSSRHPL